jgi:TrmH family RNA methyltransferase
MNAAQDALRVVLVSPRNPLNIGAAARAMSNFGFLRMRVVNAYDVAYHEAKSAVNASAVLEASEQYVTVADAVADCSLVVGTTAVGHRQLRHPLRRLEAGAGTIREALQTGRVALLFGSEKFGLSNEDLSHCHWLLRIPTRAEHESMNLGQAVAVCLYELIRSEQAAAAEPREVREATAEQRELFTELLLDLLRESGYLNPITAESSELKLRRMVSRLHLTEADAYVWFGIIRQIRWRIRSADSAGEGSPPPPVD